MSFGSKLKTLRKEKSLSQRQIAESLGMSINSISQYENDKRFPDEKVLVRLCKYYDVTSDYLLGLCETKKSLHVYDELYSNKLDSEQKELISKLIDMINIVQKE